MSNFNDRIEINTSTSVIVSFGFCNNLDLSVSVFTQPNLGLRYLDNHLLPGIYFYINHKTDLYIRKGSGTVPACHSECASNVQKIGAKSPSSNVRRRMVEPMTARQLRVYARRWYRLHETQPKVFTSPV